MSWCTQDSKNKEGFTSAETNAKSLGRRLNFPAHTPLLVLLTNKSVIFTDLISGLSLLPPLASVLRFMHDPLFLRFREVVSSYHEGRSTVCKTQTWKNRTWISIYLDMGCILTSLRDPHCPALCFRFARRDLYVHSARKQRITVPVAWEKGFLSVAVSANSANVCRERNSLGLKI
jgi:hypothetical protein